MQDCFKYLRRPWRSNFIVIKVMPVVFKANLFETFEPIKASNRVEAGTMMKAIGVLFVVVGTIGLMLGHAFAAYARVLFMALFN